MTRLDEIEERAKHPNAWMRYDPAYTLALVAVARAATQGPCRHDTSHRGETCSLCAALAPLLEQVKP